MLSPNQHTSTPSTNAGGALRDEYANAKALKLRPVWKKQTSETIEGTKSYFECECPDCGGTVIAQDGRNGTAIVECMGACNAPVDLSPRSRPLTANTFRGLAYSPEGLSQAAREPMPWLLENWLCRGQVTVLSARSGVGKSMLAGSLAAAISTRQGFLSWPVLDSGLIDWIDAEQGPNVIGRRMQLLNLPDVGVTILDGSPVVITRDRDAITEALQVNGTALLIVDSHRMVNPGVDEDSSTSQAQAMAVYRDIAQECQCAVLIIHHSGKGERSSVRGSTAIEDQCAISIVLDRPDALDREIRSVEWRKNRLGEEPRALRVRMSVEEGLLTWTLEEGAQDRLLECALILIGSQGPVSANAISKAAGLADKASEGTRKKLGKLVDARQLSVDAQRRYVRPLSAGAPSEGAAGRTEAIETAAPLRPPFRGAQGAGGVVVVRPSEGAPVSQGLSPSVMGETIERLVKQPDQSWEEWDALAHSIDAELAGPMEEAA